MKVRKDKLNKDIFFPLIVILLIIIFMKTKKELMVEGLLESFIPKSLKILWIQLKDFSRHRQTESQHNQIRFLQSYQIISFISSLQGVCLRNLLWKIRTLKLILLVLS